MQVNTGVIGNRGHARPRTKLAASAFKPCFLRNSQEQLDGH